MQCNWNTSGCPGANNDRCYPYGIWSSTKVGVDTYSNRELNSGLYENTFERSVTYAFGVRCVLDFDHILIIK